MLSSTPSFYRMGQIWKTPKGQFFKDLRLGFLLWFFAFPTMNFIGQLADIATYALFHIESFEQSAAHYLKQTMTEPFPLFTALLIILFIGPFLEEFLFRGLLQNWIKTKLGKIASILITAFCFALLHVTKGQGFGNISLVAALFSLGCFLGFLYEKQRSLWAPLALHISVNFTSAVHLVFFSP